MTLKLNLINPLLNRKYYTVPTLIKSIASKLAFGIMSDRFAGIIYNNDDKIQLGEREKERGTKTSLICFNLKTNL